MKPVKEERLIFGQRLEQYLKERGVTQDELAIQTGLSRQTINNIINGKSSATSEFLNKMAESYLDLNLNWLITGKGVMLMKEADCSNYDTRLDFTKEGLLKMLDEKDATIEALSGTIISKDEAIAVQRQMIDLQNKLINSN